MANAKQRPDAQRSLVAFRVGEVEYAVPISAVREIVNPLPLTGLPHASEVIAGVADHRGEVVPVIDLRTRFGLPPLPAPQRPKWIVIDVRSRSVALIVDRVTEVFGTGGAELRPPPMLGSGDDARGISGVTTHDRQLTFVLDVSRFETLTRPFAESELIARAER